MSNYITVQGFASSDVELETKESGLLIGKFRLGSTHRVQDPLTKQWGDGPTNWFRVTMFRTLANNVAASIRKGDHVVVTGRLHLKTWLRLDGTQGMAAEIDADTVGNDLKFGSCTYHRMSGTRTPVSAQEAPATNGVRPAAPPSPPTVGSTSGDPWGTPQPDASAAATGTDAGSEALGLAAQPEAAGRGGAAEKPAGEAVSAPDTGGAGTDDLDGGDDGAGTNDLDGGDDGAGTNDLDGTGDDGADGDGAADGTALAEARFNPETGEVLEPASPAY